MIASLIEKKSKGASLGDVFVLRIPENGRYEATEFTGGEHLGVWMNAWTSPLEVTRCGKWKSGIHRYKLEDLKARVVALQSEGGNPESGNERRGILLLPDGEFIEV